MKRYAGKNASKRRRNDEAIARQAAFEKSLPLAVRKMIARQRANCAERCALVVGGTVAEADRARYSELVVEYTELTAAIARATKGV